MGEAYPELPAQRDLIIKVIKEEEDAFLRTLENGIRLLDDAAKAAKAEGKTSISGKQAFTLYDTYGFPLDLTLLILKDYGMTIDQAEFDSEMAAQKARARSAAAVEAGDWVILADGEEEFVGYDSSVVECRILRYRHVKQKNRAFYQIILDRTPFYAEMGGQVGDRGTLTDAVTGEVVTITDTKRETGTAVHITDKMPSDPAAKFVAAIDEDVRAAVSRNHSATHLLHQALRDVLGTHVEQKGSFVSPDVLRFDFSHFQKLTREEIEAVERLANRRVREAMPLDEHRHLPIAEARAMGAMALFGEKYGDEVRVVRYGDSIELCGGTHVANTGNIGMIKIISESSIAAGIRRIEAITGPAVENMMSDVQNTLRSIGEMFNNAPDIVAALRKQIEEDQELRKQAELYFAERVDALAHKLLDNAETISSGVKVVAMNGVRVPEVVKATAFRIRELAPDDTVFIAATADAAGKPLLTVMVDNNLTATYNASQIVRQAAKLIKGGGGGQPGFAQAGGKDAEGLDAAMSELRSAFN